MPKWSVEETEKLIQMRRALRKELMSRRQLPDVVGDRRLLRFLRGHGHNVEKANKVFAKFLQWRDEFDVDSIRDHILFGGLTSPEQFPCGAKILKHMPQMMLSHEAFDKAGNPISLEHFNFVPEVVLREITKKEYTTFMIYTLEYKILLLEQLAEEREQLYLSKSPPSTIPYGIILSSRVIRDLNGFGISHIGTDGQTVIKWILELAVDNYPELLCKCHMVNVPWIFNSIWFFMKGLMDPNTVKKVTLTGTDFFKELSKEIPIKSIPIIIGGKYKSTNILIKFNTSKDGPFYYSGFENDNKYYLKNEDKNEMKDGNENKNNNENINGNQIDSFVLNFNKGDENECNNSSNKVTDKNSDLTDEETKTEIEIEEIDFENDVSCKKIESRIILHEKEKLKIRGGMTDKEKEIEIMKGYNINFQNYQNLRSSTALNHTVAQKNFQTGLIYAKKSGMHFRDRILQNGQEISHILKIGNTITMNETFIESRQKRIEEKDKDKNFRQLESVKRTKKSNSRCTDVGLMSPERSCKVNCTMS